MYSMYIQDDFVHGDTIIVCQNGLKAIKDVKEKDTIAVVDLAKDISFIRAPVERFGTKGMYHTIETDRGEIKLGSNASLFSHPHTMSTVMACDIESTLIGTTINIPAIAHAHQGNVLNMSDIDLIMTAILNIPTVDLKLRKRVRVVSPYQEYTDRAIDIFDRAGVNYDVMTSRDGTSMFIIYFDHEDVVMPLTSDIVENMNADQCKTMILLYMIFSHIKIKSMPQKRAIAIGVKEQIHHYVGLVSMKCGFPVMWQRIYYYGKFIYCLFLYRSRDFFAYKIQGATISTHEHEDIAIYLPKRYMGLLVVNNGRFIIMPTQRFIDY